MVHIVPTISIVYRSLNEEKWFEDSLIALSTQNLEGMTFETILVDSGSTDRTLEIAGKYNCKISHIKKADFSFGRSLNQGCDLTTGQYLVFISAHCIPSHDNWLQNLIKPIIGFENTGIVYSYGRQIGHAVSKFSEKQVFDKYFPAKSAVPQEGNFCNNANAAVVKEHWANIRFDERVTGLEDMVLANTLVSQGYKVAYVADAPVIHIHEETYFQTKNRYYREALTLREIMPNVHMGFVDFVRYFSSGVINDVGVAMEQKVFRKQFVSILRFRFGQYWGSYKGHTENRKLSRAQKEEYYYPKTR